MMRLSEAIRLGAMWKPQRFRGPTFPLAEESATCALAAAAEAYGDAELDALRYRWSERVPANSPAYVLCPSCREVRSNNEFGRGFGFLLTIAHLNDQHRWTRERIADWVETFEQVPAQPEAVEA